MTKIEWLKLAKKDIYKSAECNAHERGEILDRAIKYINEAIELIKLDTLSKPSAVSVSVEDIIKMLREYEPNEFKTIGIINIPGNWYASESWHIKDHMNRMADKIHNLIMKGLLKDK